MLPRTDSTHSNDPAHTAALHAYIAAFDFAGDAIDVALRKLLMELFLPRETQQIDRVMEAFAKRYHEQNPQLFVSSDQPYLLAFAMIMLHTDAFNGANKNKMTKAAFIKNTRTDPALPAEVLAYL
jgi:Sec7-like guanine-nucleotide exchange factor